MAERLPSHVWGSGRRITPFGDTPGEVRVLNRSLRERQAEACGHNDVADPTDVDGPDAIPGYPCLLMADHTFFTRTLLEEFLAGARATGASARCAITTSVFVDGTAPLQQLDRTGDGGAAYDLWYLTGPVESDDALRALPTVAIDPRESIEDPRLPPQFINEATPTRVSITSRQAMHVIHWALVLRVNLAAFVATLKELWERRPVYIVLRVLVDKLLGRFRRKRLSRIGRNCEIHPTAIIEGSWLGEGVKVGAGAIIQGSVVGDGAIIEEGVILELSVIGHKAWIGRKSVVFMSVMYDGVFASHRLTQACVLGHRVCTTGGGYIIDMNFGGPVRVLQDGAPVDPGTNFLGACLGHDVVMGTGIWIQAGREIPSGTFLIREPGDVLSRIPDDIEPGAPMVMRDGTLVPLK